ncbi:hypothetical protein VNO77_25769 [Canavalia gladiata]|uniref:Uncharacterized protein n=1 Tax=Canavalia gladiata TaxID=3824 RepID=A0AAN9KR61_CANGL
MQITYAPIPPKLKRKAGRLNKQRRKDTTEKLVNSHKLKQKLKDFTCKVCGETKHNKQTCLLAKKYMFEQLQAQQQATARLGDGESSVGRSDVDGSHAIGLVTGGSKVPKLVHVVGS